MPEKKPLKETIDQNEKESLIEEKIKLAKKLGIWKTYNPVPDYEQNDDYKRIREIDKRLAELG